jgi:hypothetical protein
MKLLFFLVLFNLWFWAGIILWKESEWWHFNPLQLRKDGVIKLKDVGAFILVIPAATLGTIMDKVLRWTEKILDIEVSGK